MIKQVELNTKRIQQLPTYKFGFQIPRNHKEAMELDAKNSNRLWYEAMKKELKKLVE